MSDEPGRNSPCPCGSGKKYKVCCGAENGDRKAEPQPPAEQEVEVLIEKEVRWAPQAVMAKRTKSGGMMVSFIVNEGGQSVQHTYQVPKESKGPIVDAATGGLHVPT